MIKNKSILEEIARQKEEVSCRNCRHCNQNAYYGGRWYCKIRSVFEIISDIEKCFERKQ